MTKEPLKGPVTRPEVRQFLRAMQSLTRDLPDLFQREKQIAFRECRSVSEYEAHMARIYQVSHRLEEVATLLGDSFQFAENEGALSRIFRDLYQEKHSDRRARPSRPAPPDINPLTGNVVQPPAAAPGDAFQKRASSPVADAVEAREKVAGTEVERRHRDPEHARLRSEILERIGPHGRVTGRNMYENAEFRIVTATAKEKGPWRFKVRKSSLEWAGQDEMRKGLVLFICGRLGHVLVPSLPLAASHDRHFHRDSSGNIGLRPSIVRVGAEAKIHPGAVRDSARGDVLRCTFVEE